MSADCFVSSERPSVRKGLAFCCCCCCCRLVHHCCRFHEGQARVPAMCWVCSTVEYAATCASCAGTLVELSVLVVSSPLQCCEMTSRDQTSGHGDMSGYHVHKWYAPMWERKWRGSPERLGCFLVCGRNAQGCRSHVNAVCR